MFLPCVPKGVMLLSAGGVIASALDGFGSGFFFLFDGYAILVLGSWDQELVSLSFVKP